MTFLNFSQGHITIMHVTFTLMLCVTLNDLEQTFRVTKSSL